MLEASSDETSHRHESEATGGLGIEPKTPAPVLQRMADYAVREIPGAKYAGVTTVGSPVQMETVAMTHPLAVMVDAIQQYHRQGPCLSDSWKRDMLRVNDLNSDLRWDDYRRDVIRSTPIRSLIAFRLFTTPNTLGVLTVYSDRPRVFDREAEHIGYIIATHTRRAGGQNPEQDTVPQILAHRHVILQAQDALMERFRINRNAAAQMLNRLTLSSTTDLLEISRQVIAIRERL